MLVGNTPLSGLLVAALGAGMLAMSIRGLSPNAGHKWARQLFAASLVYLPLLFAALAVDALV